MRLHRLIGHDDVARCEEDGSVTPVVAFVDDDGRPRYLSREQRAAMTVVGEWSGATGYNVLETAEQP